jgi:hypothetical protein
MTFTSPYSTKLTLENQVFQIKHDSLDLLTDLKTKNRSPLLILHWHPTIFNLGKLIEEAKTLGFKSWVLKSRKRNGSQEEFEKALDFIKEKPLVLAFGNWINQIQKSSKLDFTVAVRPKFELEELNQLARDENQRKLKNLENWKKKQLGEIFASEPPQVILTSEIPKFDCKKPILIYTNQNLDNTPKDLQCPVIFDTKSFLKREPLGNKELFVLKLAISLRDSLNMKSPSK